MSRAKRRRRSLRAVLRRIPRVAVAVVVLFSVLVTANGTWRLPWLPTWDDLYAAAGLAEPSVVEGTLRVTVLDVGNADCLLVQNGDSAALIDAGENKTADNVLAALGTAGVKELDCVVATHADADHIGGMDEVVRELEIDTFVMATMPPEHTPTSRTYQNLLDALEERELPITEAEYGDCYAVGDAQLTVLSGKREYTDTNDQSVVCRLRFGEHDFLLMGDAGKDTEEDLLEDGVPLAADVIKVGHHGSKTSSDEAFIQAVNPEYALITCGANNRYGHPHEETLRTLEEQGITVYRSDLNGDIVITSDGETLTFETQR